LSSAGEVDGEDDDESSRCSSARRVGDGITNSIGDVGDALTIAAALTGIDRAAARRWLARVADADAEVGVSAAGGGGGGVGVVEVEESVADARERGEMDDEVERGERGDTELTDEADSGRDGGGDGAGTVLCCWLLWLCCCWFGSGGSEILRRWRVGVPALVADGESLEPAPDDGGVTNLMADSGRCLSGGRV